MGVALFFYSHFLIFITAFQNSFCTSFVYLRYNDPENKSGRNVNMHIEEFDNVL